MSATGKLYVVATPIGNLGDITQRALATLAAVDLVAAEDTRRCRQLLDHFGIQAKTISYHDYSARARLESLIGRLVDGASIALVSDAGTPLIADPGYELVNEARRSGIEVVAVPGACAAAAALSIAGLPSDRFIFEGFLPARGPARRARLHALCRESRTMIFYEAPHRIAQMLDDCIAVFGADRRAVVARELTKRFETVRDDSLAVLREQLDADPNQLRGEQVLLVAGAGAGSDEELEEGLRIVEILGEKLSHRDAVALASRISGCARNALYEASISSK